MYNYSMKLERLSKETIRFISENNFPKLTRIQDAVLDVATKGKDLVAISKTGTGKTHAYLIPIMEMIDESINELQVIISVPTRELGQQMKKYTKLMSQIMTNLRVKISLTGSDNTHITNFTAPPHILISTPGRLKKLYEKECIRLDRLKMFVIDEADMTLEYGFLEDLDLLFSKSLNAQFLCFSATYPQEFKNFVKKYFVKPQIIKIEDNSYMNPKIEHILVNAKHKKYHELLLDVLPSFNPYVCLIFANTRNEASECANFLRGNDYKVLEMHGGLAPRARKQALKALQNHEYSYVVCSDVASRGLDIEGVSHVVSLGLPTDLSFYTHRSGRTGRSGREGVCFLIYKEEDMSSLKVLSEEIAFKHKSYKNGISKILKSISFKKVRKNDLREKEIARKITKKKEKVKPNYKKKKRELIKKIKQKERQQFIRKKIQEEKRERYRTKAYQLYHEKNKD